jgi:dipeptidase
MSMDEILEGTFERPISMFRTSYSFVATARKYVPDELALLWLSVYAPSTSSYTPLYIHADAAPQTLTR